MRRWLDILFWSVIAAAFIGPGTVTTCASAGSRFGLHLMWALTFSTIACFVLQEGSARVTIATGLDLGGAIRRRFRGRRTGPVVLLLVLGGILLGCAAYEAGNILGAVAGAELGLPLPGRAVTLACGGAAALLLWFGRTQLVARVLGGAVALMGIAFLAVAVRLKPQPGDLLRHALLPALPDDSGLLVLGLIGTTVVPYNLFLGSGLARGQSLVSARIGLAVAIPAGGLMSMAVLVVGTAVPGPLEFEGLAGALADRLGAWAAPLFASGLFIAGLSSAITAPLAAAVTARGLFGADRPGAWEERGWRYRAVWIPVLLVGVASALAGASPIPAILAAQALNGMLLPFVAVFLFILINDRDLMGASGRNGTAANVLMSAVIFVTLLLGARMSLGAFASALGLGPPGAGVILAVSLLAAALVVAPLMLRLCRRAHPRRGDLTGKPGNE